MIYIYIYICIYICIYIYIYILSRQKDRKGTNCRYYWWNLHLSFCGGAIWYMFVLYYIYIYLCAWSCWNIGTVKANGWSSLFQFNCLLRWHLPFSDTPKWADVQWHMCFFYVWVRSNLFNNHLCAFPYRRLPKNIVGGQLFSTAGDALQLSSPAKATWQDLVCFSRVDPRPFSHLQRHRSSLSPLAYAGLQVGWMNSYPWFWNSCAYRLVFEPKHARFQCENQSLL